MPTSGDRDATDLTAPYRDALHEVLRALDPINPWDGASDDVIMRLTEVISALRCMNMSNYSPEGVAGHAEDLHRRIAELPTGAAVNR